MILVLAIVRERGREGERGVVEVSVMDRFDGGSVVVVGWMWMDGAGEQE